MKHHFVMHKLDCYWWIGNIFGQRNIMALCKVEDNADLRKIEFLTKLEFSQMVSNIIMRNKRSYDDNGPGFLQVDTYQSLFQISTKIGRLNRIKKRLIKYFFHVV